MAFPLDLLGISRHALWGWHALRRSGGLFWLVSDVAGGGGDSSRCAPTLTQLSRPDHRPLAVRQQPSETPNRDPSISEEPSGPHMTRATCMEPRGQESAACVTAPLIAHPGRSDVEEMLPPTVADRGGDVCGGTPCGRGAEGPAASHGRCSSWMPHYRRYRLNGRAKGGDGRGGSTQQRKFGLPT